MKMVIRISLFIIIAFVSLPLHAASEADLRRALELSYNNSVPEAEKIIAVYLKKDPNDARAYIVWGTVLDWKRKHNNLGEAGHMASLEKYKKANQLAFWAWEKDPDNIDRNITLGNSYMYLAKKWIDLDKSLRAGLILKKCRKHMELAMKRDPKRYDAYMAIGIFNYYAGNLPPGLSFLASFLGISGDEATGLRQLQTAADNPHIFQMDAQLVYAHTLGKSKKDYAKAIPRMSALVSKYSRNAYFKQLLKEFTEASKKPDVIPTEKTPKS